MSTPRSSRCVLLVLIASLLFAACGGSDDEQEAGGAAADAAAADLPESPTIDRVRDSGTLRVGVAIALPWLGQNPRTNEYFGPATLIAEETAKRLGVELEYVPETFDTIVAALQSNKIDMADAALYATPEREAVIDMVPWSVGGYCYLTQKDNPISSTEELKSPDITMANFVGTGTFEAVKRAYPDAKQVTRTAAAGEGANIPEIRSGKADVTPFDAALAKVYEKEYPDLKIFPEDCFENPDLPTPVAVGLPKGDDGFSQLVTDVVDSLQPQLDEQFEKYGQPEYVEQQGS